MVLHLPISPVPRLKLYGGPPVPYRAQRCREDVGRRPPRQMQQAAPAGQNEERLDFAAELHIVVQAPGKGGGTMRWWENPNPKPWGFTWFYLQIWCQEWVPDQGHTCPLCGVQFVVQICGQQKTSKDTQLQWKMPTALQMARLKTGKNHPASCIMVAPWKFQGATMSGMMTRNKGRNPDSPIKKKKRPKFKRFRMQHGFVWKSRGKPLNPSVSFIIFPMKLVIWNYLEAYQAYFLFRHTVPNLGYAGHRSCRKKMTGEG